MNLPVVPFNDLRTPFKELKAELLDAIHRVAASGAYLMGPELAAFEKEFGAYVGSEHVASVGSGTDALTLAIRALGLGSGDEVVVPANSYPTAFGVAASGVTMKLCDVNPDTLVVDRVSLEKEIGKNTKAVIIVHLYGMPAPMDEILELSKERKIFVIEDCAQATGAMIQGRHVGTFGDIGCFSFYPTKNLGAMGDGGAVVTREPSIANRVQRLRMYGEDVRYQSLESSTHSRLDEIQSAILRVKLRHLDRALERRQEIARWLRSSLSENMRIPLSIPTDVRHAFHLFVIRHQQRDALREFLSKNGVESLIHYPFPIHLVPAFRQLGYSNGDFPVSEKASVELLSLPIYPSLSKADQDRIAELVSSSF